MDSDFKKILEHSYISNTSELSYSDIKKQLLLNMRSDKLKTALKLIYKDELKEIKYKNTTFYNVDIANTPVRSLLNNTGFFKVNDFNYIKNNHEVLHNLFNLSSDTDSKKVAAKKIKKIAYDIIYFCLSIGVPIEFLAYLLNYSSTLISPKKLNLLYREKVNYFKSLNCSCSKCGKEYNLTVHHVKKQGAYSYLKYNPFNWLILCSSCHNELHNKI